MQFKNIVLVILSLSFIPVGAQAGYRELFALGSTPANPAASLRLGQSWLCISSTSPRLLRPWPNSATGANPTFRFQAITTRSFSNSVPAPYPGGRVSTSRIGFPDVAQLSLTNGRLEFLNIDRSSPDGLLFSELSVFRALPNGDLIAEVSKFCHSPNQDGRSCDIGFGSMHYYSDDTHPVPLSMVDHQRFADFYVYCPKEIAAVLPGHTFEELMALLQVYPSLTQGEETIVALLNAALTSVEQEIVSQRAERLRQIQLNYDNIAGVP